MIAFVAVLILLAAAPAAAAKEISKVEVCGEGECNVLVPGKGVDGIKQRDLEALNEVVGPADPPRAAAGWFRVRTVIRHPGEDTSWTNAWVPSARLLRTRDESGKGYTWFTVPRDTMLSLLKVTRKLTPLPASTLRGLDAKLPAARVDRVIEQSLPEPSGAAAFPWGWIALAAACLAGAGVAFPRARGRRR